jgi:hypothetical protein
MQFDSRMAGARALLAAADTNPGERRGGVESTAALALTV